MDEMSINIDKFNRLNDVKPESRWTVDEEEFLREHCKKFSYSEIGKMVNKTRGAVASKANSLNIKKINRHILEPRYLNIKLLEELTPVESQVLIGSLLGDGCIDNHITGKFPCFKEGHSSKQEFYIRWKADCLKKLGARIYEQKPSGTNDLSFKLCTTPSLLFSVLRQEIYGEIEYGYKQDYTYLIDRLEPLGLAVWFMDDGFCGNGTNNLALNIATNSFPEASLFHAIRKFKEKFGLNPSNNNSNKCCLYFGARGSEGQKLADLIKPFLLDGFLYKIKEEKEKNGCSS